jgi:hypothetical protein
MSKMNRNFFRHAVLRLQDLGSFAMTRMLRRNASSLAFRAIQEGARGYRGIAGSRVGPVFHISRLTVARHTFCFGPGKCH